MPHVSLALAVTPFRSELRGVALRLGLRTLASLASLRTLVVSLPSAVLVGQIITACCYSSFWATFSDPRKRAKKGLFLGSSKMTLFWRFLTSPYITLASSNHHQHITSSSTYIITSHHKTLQLSTTSKITILGVKKGSKMTPKTTPKNDPFLTLFGPQIHHHQIIIINVINTSS